MFFFKKKRKSAEFFFPALLYNYISILFLSSLQLLNINSMNLLLTFYN